MVVFDDSPYELFTYRKHPFDRTGRIRAPLRLDVNPIHNEVGTITLTLDDEDPQVGKLIEKGARLHVVHRDQLLMTGPVRAWSLKGDGVSGTAEFIVEDDLRLLTRILGWVRPLGSVSGTVINGQGDEDSYY